VCVSGNWCCTFPDIDCLLLLASQAPASHSRRDLLLEIQRSMQDKWRVSKLFEVDAPKPGQWPSQVKSVKQLVIGTHYTLHSLCACIGTLPGRLVLMLCKA
jgi:hypothetical protein